MMASLLFWITGFLPCRIISDGDTPYLERYYLCTLLGWRFYLHRFVGSDPDRGLHDHPWNKAYSLILSGWYWEETRSGTRRVKWFNSLTGDTFHRVVLPWAYQSDIPAGTLGYGGRAVPCWTMFFHTTGKAKAWGFLRPFSDSPDCKAAVFTPYVYDKPVTNWWLTAPKGRAIREVRT